MVKNLPSVQEMWVQSLGWEDPLEKVMATHSSILAWTIPWTEEPGGLYSIELQRVGHDSAATTHRITCLTDALDADYCAGGFDAWLQYQRRGDDDSVGKWPGKSNHADLWGDHGRAGACKSGLCDVV